MSDIPFEATYFCSHGIPLDELCGECYPTDPKVDELAAQLVFQLVHTKTPAWNFKECDRQVALGKALFSFLAMRHDGKSQRPTP